VTIGPEGIALGDYALFTSKDSPAITALRRARFHQATDDATLADLTFASELGGASQFLNDLIEDHLHSSTVSDLALALTLAGFRMVTPGGNSLLSADWGTGFLGDVATAARNQYERAGWTDHWLRIAASADTGQAFWRAALLAGKVADARAFRSLVTQVDAPGLKTFGSTLTDRIDRASKKRREARKKTLFGQRAPSRDLARLLIQADWPRGKAIT
jgi:hypothetical protein